MLPLHIWTWVIFLYKIPSYLLSLRLGQLLGIFSYTQMFALLESLLLWLAATLLALVLPRRLYLNWYVPQTLLLAAALTGWAIGYQFAYRAIQNETAAWDGAAALYWALGWLAAFLVGAASLRLVKPLADSLTRLADRLTVLAVFFLAVDLAGTALVLARNLIGWISA